MEQNAVVALLPAKHVRPAELLAAVPDIERGPRGAAHQQQLLIEFPARNLEIEPAADPVRLEKAVSRRCLGCNDRSVGPRSGVAARRLRSGPASRILPRGWCGSRLAGTPVGLVRRRGGRRGSRAATGAKGRCRRQEKECPNRPQEPVHRTVQIGWYSHELPQAANPGNGGLRRRARPMGWGRANCIIRFGEQKC